jgi:sugar/nucleoside kinase (ribokinase family)
VDILVDVEDTFLAEHGLAKGTMTLVDAGVAEKLYSLVEDGVECSGGSAANTVVGLASVGGSGAYIGKVRDDGLGRVFAGDMAAAGIDFPVVPATAGPPSGRCLVLVTPDAQRTMQTCLGISAELSARDLDRDAIEGSQVTYLEGYLWDPPGAKQAMLEAARMSRAKRRQVSLTLSDPFCVDRHREEFLALIDEHVDILFANEVEILSMFHSEDFDEAVRSIRDRVQVAAITRGPRGAVVLSGPETHVIDAEPVATVVDTTGAGDLFAAGFLYGITRGRGLAECGRYGCIAAAEIISHHGARPAERLRDRIAEVEARGGA